MGAHVLLRQRIEQTYASLWALAERRINGRATLYILYRGIDPEGRGVGNEGGCFYRRDNGQAVIELDRPYYGERGMHFMQRGRVMPTHRIMREMFVLAHEHGHAVSAERGDAGADYYSDDVLGRFKRDAEKRVRMPRDFFRRVIAEERRAWRYARETLRALDWRDWRSFRTRARRALATYETVPHS